MSPPSSTPAQDHLIVGPVDHRPPQVGDLVTGRTAFGRPTRHVLRQVVRKLPTADLWEAWGEPTPSR